MFQEPLLTLKIIAQKHNVSMANVATRYILANLCSGVIIGVRLGIVDYIYNNVQVFNFCFNKRDWDVIETVRKKSNDLFEIIGDCGD